jgi:hypothetical protein
MFGLSNGLPPANTAPYTPPTGLILGGYMPGSQALSITSPLKIEEDKSVSWTVGAQLSNLRVEWECGTGF